MADVLEQWVPTSDGTFLNPRHIVEARPSSVDGSVQLALANGETRTMALPSQQQQQPEQPAAPPAATGATAEAQQILSAAATDVEYLRSQIERAGRVLDPLGG